MNTNFSVKLSIIVFFTIIFNFSSAQITKTVKFEDGSIYVGTVDENNDPNGKGVKKIYHDEKLFKLIEGNFVGGDLDGLMKSTVFLTEEYVMYIYAKYNKGVPIEEDQIVEIYNKQTNKMVSQCALVVRIDNPLLGKGLYKIYDDDGKIYEEGKGEFMINQLKLNGSGTKKKFENNKLLSIDEGIFVDGKLNGIGSRNVLESNDGFRIEGDFHNNYPNGLIKIYDDRGLLYDGEFARGKPNGKGEINTFLENGDKISIKGFYKDGIPIGDYSVSSNGVVQTFNELGSDFKNGKNGDINENKIDNIKDLADKLGDYYIANLKESLSGKWEKKSQIM